MTKKLHDGDHVLPSGATLTVRSGVPVKLRLEDPDDDATAMTEAEELAGVWLEFVEGSDDEDVDDDDFATGYDVEVMEAQPTHRFVGGESRIGSGSASPYLVRLVEEDIAGGTEARYHGRFLCALDREAHEEGEDAGGWPPFLDGDTWRDGWTGKPMPGARVEALSTEPQA